MYDGLEIFSYVI